MRVIRQLEENVRTVVRALKRRVMLLCLSEIELRHSLVGPAKLWKMKREFQINFLKEVGLEPRHYLLDIGCGTLRGGIPLIEYLNEERYFGIERRKEVLDEGRKELAERGLTNKKPQLIVADISNVSLAQEFDFIWAFSVLIHMHNHILYDALNFISKHLSDTGFFYANVQIGNKADRHWQGFPLVWRSLSFYEEACSRNRLAVSDVGPLKGFGHLSGDKSQDEHRMLKVWKVR